MLKVGMVGMGGISRSHTTSWAQIPEVKVVAVCDIRAEYAEKIKTAENMRKREKTFYKPGII